MLLSDKALLTQLTVHQWSARKYDKRATRDVAIANGAAEAAGRYNKSLLPMSDQLAAVHKKASFIRQKYYQNTLPWGVEGTQMLPTANYLGFIADFRKERSEWEVLVRDFITDYPRLVSDARAMMGTLYDPADYPPTRAVAEKFGMDISVMPVPTDDFRVEVGEEELISIQAEVAKRVKDAQGKAMKAVWQRLYDKVAWMAERLADPDKKFQTGTYEAAQELCALLPRLNFADDQDLEAMRKQVADKLASHSPDALRNDPVLRKQVADTAQDIAAKMQVFMGGAG